MAVATTFKYSKLIILLEDQTTPGNYAAPCGLTERSFSLSKELTDILVPDCADEDAPAWTGRDVRSISASINGSGVLASESFEEWRSFAQSTVFRNVRVIIAQDTTGTTPGDGGFWTFKAHVESFEITGNIGEKVQISIALQSDGEAVWTPH